MRAQVGIVRRHVLSRDVTCDPSTLHSKRKFLFLDSTTSTDVRKRRITNLEPRSAVCQTSVGHAAAEMTVVVSSSRGGAVHEPIKHCLSSVVETSRASRRALGSPSCMCRLRSSPSIPPPRSPLALAYIVCSPLVSHLSSACPLSTLTLSFSLHPLCVMELQGLSSQGWLKTTLTKLPIYAMTANTRQEMTPFLISPSKPTKPANDTNQMLHPMSDEHRHI